MELLRGEKELTVIASENEIAPNQIRNWKAEFLENAAAAFDDKKSENLKAELKGKESETDTLYKKVGQLTTQVDWLKKKSEELFGPDWESKYTPRPKIMQRCTSVLGNAAFMASTNPDRPSTDAISISCTPRLFNPLSTESQYFKDSLIADTSV